MTDTLMIDDYHCSKSIMGTMLNKYGRLAAFTPVWALANMIFVDIIFNSAFNEQPFQIVKFFATIH